MKEVSCKITRAALESAERFNVPIAPRLADFPYSIDYLRNPRNRINWDEFSVLQEALMQGLSDDEIVRMSAECFTQVSSIVSFIGSMSGYFASCRTYFRFCNRVAIPSLFSNVEISDEVLPDGRIRVRMVIPEPFRECRAFFITSAGSMVASPQFLGLPKAIVDFSATGREAVYDCRLPPSGTLWARLCRAYKALFAARTAIDELHAQYSEMAEGHSQMNQMHRGFADIIDRLPDGIIVMRKGRIVYANSAVEHMLGLASADAMKGRLLEDFVLPEDAPMVQQAIGATSSGTSPAEVRFAGGGDPVTVLLQFVRGIQFGGQISDFCIAHNVTETRRLEQEIVEASTREQKRLSHELHDNLVQLMAGAIYESTVVMQALEEKSPTHAEELAHAIGINRDAMKEARAIARRMDPVQLHRNNFSASLEELAVLTRDSYKVDCTYRPAGDLPVIEHNTAIQLYRIAQEALSNAVRHAQPRTILMTLGYDDGHLALTVLDDGCGMPANLRDKDGMGLRNMRYRARMIGAELALSPHEPTGTRVCCTLKL